MKSQFCLLTLIIFLFVTDAHSQPVVYGMADTFGYDAAGYRIKREYVYTIVALKQRHDVPVDTLVEKFAKAAIYIKAYPNPTANEMIVENLSWQDGHMATVKIFDITGKLLQSRSFNDAKERFSLSGVVPGMYQVNYYLDNRLTTTWKIIKK